ncbi:MAG: hypothetical protein R3182_12755, partial [Draconibacterium sp.]|nr:hypothetical protein [Draconibacterium sp.]
MKNKINLKITVLLLIIAVFGTSKDLSAQKTKQFHADKPFTQEFSIKYEFENSRIELKKVVSDRNGYIQVLTSHGLMRPNAGQFLYPGTLVNDIQYLPTSDKGITDITVIDNQLVYVDDNAVLSNAWAGKLYSRHNLPATNLFEAGNNFEFLISDGLKLNLLKDSETLWEGETGDKIRDIKFDSANNQYWILGEKSVSVCSPSEMKVEKVLTNSNLTSIEVAGDKLFVGTSDGYFKVDTKSKKQVGDVQKKLPWTEITTISEIDGKVWFGSTRGAFMLNDAGKYDYYASKRWIPSDNVLDIAKG